MGALKLLPMLAIGPVANLLAWGTAFPTDVPAFTVKVSEDDEKAHFFDPLAFTGLRRGAKTLGISAGVEGLRKGQTGGQIADQALLRDMPLQIEHLFAGPPVQALHTFATGEDVFGHRVAPRASTAQTARGMAEAARNPNLLPPGSSEVPGRAKAALFGINPIAKTLTQQDKHPRTWIENILQSAGPFGIKTTNKPKVGGRRK